MKKRILILCAVLVLVLAGILLPFVRKIDMTTPAMEYSLADPDYVVAHTVTIRGSDTRNLLGRGIFEGTFDVSGIDNGEFQKAIVRFPMPGDCQNVWFSEPNGYTQTQEVFSLVPKRDWSSFSALLMDLAERGGHINGHFSADTGRFLVSGTPTRDEALAILTAAHDWAFFFQS